MFERLLDRAERLTNNSEFYIAIWLVGSVIAFLYLLNGSIDRVFLVFYLVLWLMATLRIMMERRYFQRYDAILSSSQFILIPYLVILVGLFVSPYTETILIERLSFFMGNYQVLFLHTTLFGFPHLIFQSYIFWKIHRKEWLGFAVHRKLFRSRLIPFLLHTVLVASLAYFSIAWKTVDPLSVIAIAFWGFATIKYYILRRHILRRATTRHQEIPFRSTHSNSFLNNYLNRPSRPGGNRSRSTSPSNGRSKASSIARIEPGKEVKVRGNGKTKSKLLPKGQVKKEDLACTICYDPIRSNDGTIVLCPHCRFPAHEKELKEWRKESNLCPRCSKAVSRITATQKVEATTYCRQVLSKLR